ncbi:MAG: hypothetical protein IKB14_04535 [Rikenellaceae bacterium]|nr:hypothetical protein [Rikenellaceae bacterium]
MKRLLLIFFILIALSNTLSAQNFVPKNYRSLSECGQDTIAYLKHNWGIGTGFRFYERTIGDFFDFYDLPIVDVLLRLGGNERLVTVRFFFEPAEKELSNPKNYNKYHVCLELERGDNAEDQRRPDIQRIKTLYQRRISVARGVSRVDERLVDRGRAV